ncbi:malto-oligosyltrehalose synthase [Fimicolochytrium jonesii]|uniref:malto-oligosyltrehalose synthase n=1 Tax=Fimicolochytrium jonesii TaxID=1396493 RepID=UPI0022FE253C|nr:malto-oligosyltrehalose synthase [Fimicolochytrium jonesii]KAI8817931.1 malto-oligosyltrehalose synthase [Fimicolochytrium jonesii]
MSPTTHSAKTAANVHRPVNGKKFPTSTYRVQLRKEFGFEKAEALVEYLKSLGVTHLYCSPYLQATPGSAHGYDVVNHSIINEELGGEKGFETLIKKLHSHGLRAIADIVPNHVSVADPEHLNPYWWDVLKNGRNSKYGGYFDVEWDHPQLKGKILLPVLGGQPADLVKNGEIKYETKGPDGVDGPVIRYYSHVFPVKPGTENLKHNIEQLLDAQNYRLAFWRVTMDGLLNYRRFFDVTTLAGIRVEDESVFRESHKIFIQQIKDGVLDGLRVDHPDGLADPQQYVERLAEATDGSWIVIEKILEEGEELPASWPCAGTSGYDALIRLNGLLVDRKSEKALTDVYAKFTGLTGDFNSVMKTSKHLILEKSLRAEVERLMSLLVLVQQDDASAKALTRENIHEALVALLVAFDVYRAYIQPGKSIPKESLVHLNHAAENAKKALKGSRDSEVDFIVRAASFKVSTSDPAREFVSRLQQTCGPVMAKGIEDTAFYRYFRLASLNEVGGDPGVFGKSVDEFHKASAAMQKDWSLSMTTLSTHDTKRSEDVRARLAVISELPTEWETVVNQWSATADQRGYRTSAALPDKNTEYLFWQTLVGAYPISIDRLTAYMDKATKEGKVHTSHTDANKDFDAAVKSYAEKVLADTDLITSISTFVNRIKPFGRLNSLAQKTIQLTMPGIPDVYQGCEVEDYSLVDPDNRREIDYEARKSLLAKLDSAAPQPPADATDNSGAGKMWVVSRLLRLREEHPDVFVGPEASYTALAVMGQKDVDNVVAFERSGKVVTVAPRFWVGVKEGGALKGVSVRVPEGEWRNVLTGETVKGGVVDVERLVRAFPVAVLVKQ